MLAMWVLALLEDDGPVWHCVTLEGTCKPAWARGFVPMCFAYHPGRNPKPLQAGPGSPNWAYLILLREKKKKLSQKASPGRVSKTNPEPWLTIQKWESSQSFSFSLSGGGSPAALQPGQGTWEPRCHQCWSLTPRPWQEEQTQLGTSGCRGGGASRDAREAHGGSCAGSRVGTGHGVLGEVLGQQEKSPHQAPRDRLWSREPG